MITPAQQAYIQARAYVPEHLPAYVTAISQTEPFLIEEFVAHVCQDRLVFIGYPLGNNVAEDQLVQALDQAITRFEPTAVSVTVSTVPSALREYEQAPSDFYYRVELSTLSPSQKVRNMIRRAGSVLAVEKSQTFGQEHREIVQKFLRAHKLDRPTEAIFNRLPEYTKTGSAWIYEARNEREELVAFDIADFGSKSYAFYMFNFYSRRNYVPGASDLLLSKIVDQARAEGKIYLNLGLGINPGVTFFKTKWGGQPFLSHIGCLRQVRRVTFWDTLLDNLT